MTPAPGDSTISGTPAPGTTASGASSPGDLFRSEYEQELEEWLRRRFRMVCMLQLALNALVVVGRVTIIGSGNEPWWPTKAALMAITIAAGAGAMGVVAQYLFGRFWLNASRAQLLRGATMLVLSQGGIAIARGILLQTVAPGQGGDFILPLFFTHLIFCLFLPWSAMESVKPFVPLLAMWGLGVLFLGSDSWAGAITQVALAPGILIPGVAICYLRLKSHSESFQTRMVGQHFLSMRQEFSKARAIHESLFPAPLDDGHVRFEYTYAPMRELGGDYVHLQAAEDGLVHLTVLDVTGHGLPAALTVNRLYGELERIRGESPLAAPGEVLSLLNRYVHLTMIRHNIFATALCMTLDPMRGRLSWANAGHPPAFVRGANGVVTRLPATTVLLGALDAKEFVADEKKMELSPGDVIVAYTDGAFEARDRSGEQMGLGRIEGMLHANPPPRNWASYLAQAVQRHNAGRNDDDILIAAMTYLSPRAVSADAARAGGARLVAT